MVALISRARIDLETLNYETKGGWDAKGVVTPGAHGGADLE